ncbi:hypothetical protein ACFWOL_20745 [Streptomyces sp. NPDC058442]|uniref:hypothetical protein n=1 Tax=Streptomyces sp. NPDC058442 TaxID=3346503 RepID=UPI0036490980
MLAGDGKEVSDGEGLRVLGTEQPLTVGSVRRITLITAGVGSSALYPCDRRKGLLDVWADSWAVVAESDRVQWDYAPLERVGPLSFGMSVEEAGIAMEACGFTSDTASGVGKFGPFEHLRTRFRAAGAPFHRDAVTAYYVGPMGLTCIAVDALTGPQVTFDGIRLIGRPPSELSAELTAHAEKTGRQIQITTGGDIGSQELGMNPRAQRAGDVVLTRLVFGRPNDWANTMFDCIPADEMLSHY